MVILNNNNYVQVLNNLLFHLNDHLINQLIFECLMYQKNSEQYGQINIIFSLANAIFEVYSVKLFMIDF